MATTIFTPSMLRNGTRATPEIEGGGGGGFSNTKSFYNFNSGGDTNLPATANLGDLSYLNNQSNVTTSVWFETPSIVSDMGLQFVTILGNRGSVPFRFQVATGGGNMVFSLVINSTNALSSNTSNQFTPNTWYHVLMHFNGTSGDIKLNGVSLGNINPSPTSFTTSTSTPTFFGGTGTLTEYNATQLSMWNRVLTPTEISDVYNSGCPSDISSLNPNTWLKMDDAFQNGSGLTLPDSGGDNATVTSLQQFPFGIQTDSPCP